MEGQSLNTSKKISWVTLSKFLGLYLMILGHQNLVDKEQTDLIFAFHMPLFFILSGMFSSNRDFLRTLNNVWKKLIFPFISMTLLVILIQMVLWIKNKYSLADITPYLIGSFLCPGKSFYGLHPLCITLWFLLALAEVKLIASLLKNHTQWIITIAICIMAALYINTKTINLPLALDSALLAVPFFYIGKLSKSILQKDLNTSLYALITIISAIILLLHGINGRVDINNAIFGRNILLFYLNGFAGTIFIIYIIRTIGSAVPPSWGG